VGDDLYGEPRHRAISDRRVRMALMPPRPLLHAWRLDLPELPGGGPVRLEAPLPVDFLAALDAAGLGDIGALERPQG
jgi:hypothetical protein